MKANPIQRLMIILCFGLISARAMAQSLMMQPPPENKIAFRVRFFRPDFKGYGDDLSILSGVYQIFVSIPMPEEAAFLIMLPYGTYRNKYGGNDHIGDLFLGAQTRIDTQSYCTFGLYLPTADEDEYGVNINSMFTNYHELYQFAPNTLTIYGNVTIISHVNEALKMHLEFGPHLWIPSKNESDADTEILIHYGLSGHVYLNPVVLSCELYGQFILSEEIDDFEDRFLNFLAIGAQLNHRKVRPGIFYQIPLKEDMREYLQSTLGIQCQVVL
ncbi:hypothetical protein JW835_05145 [bacterium]|nr:hypothetical protein [bacterium]